ncbi:MAG TPA: carboxypeptidase regulatory-like domain-containing protein [Terriglobia bacterium]|nr:carboxypeptidase regulatory-like domain-containing protein [Terriglobia bacterium]
MTSYRKQIQTFVFPLIMTALAALTPCAFGQATYGNIIGTVMDSTGAAVPGVQVSIKNVATGVVVTAETNDSGNYTAPNLLPGTYTLNFSKQGFQSFSQQNVTVVVGTSSRVDAKLQVGSMSQTVTVTGAPPLLQTTNAEVTTDLTSHTLQSLPVINRNFTSFELLVPGTVKNNFQHPLNENPGNDILVNTNGQEYANDNFMIDGTTNNDAVLGIINVNPPLDSIQEAKVTTSNYQAEFSQAGGSVIQVQTKSGSNQIHGSIFEYLQNDIFQARDPFTQGIHAPGTPAPAHRGIPELRWNQFGGSVGGPIKKDKAWWFFDYQGNREDLGGSTQTRVPTAAERQGSLADLGVNIYNPATGNPDGTGRQLFAGAQIPTTSIVSQATNLLNFLPLPNLPGASGPGENYLANGVNNYDTDQFDIRVDHNLTDKFTYFGRYSYENIYVLSPGAFGLYGGPEVNPQGVNMYEGRSNGLTDNGVLGADYTISPTMLTDFRFGATRYRVLENPLDANTNLAAQAGIPGINLPSLAGSGGLPDMNINGTGAFQMGFQCNCPLHETENVFQWVNNWTKIVGNHTIKWGGQVEAAQNLRLPSDNHRAGVYAFQPNVTSSLTDTNSGSGLASFLLGDPSQFQRFAQISTNQQDRQKRMFYFAQDTWRITPKLTLNYGLRWDTWFADTSLHPGQGGRYDISNNTVYIPGVGGVSQSGGVNTDYHNFSLRLAIAYALTPKTVIRTGYGRSYFAGTFGWNFNDLAADIYPSIVNQNLSTTNSFFPVQFVAGAPPAQPSLGAAPPLPVFPAIPSNGQLLLPDGIGTPHIPTNNTVPWVDSYNFTVEHQFGASFTASAGYVGNVGRDLNMGWNMNSAIPGPGTNFDLRRPYFAQFGIEQTIFNKCDCESSNYNALQVQVVKKYSNNLSIIANYTYQRALDFGEFGTATDQYDTKLDYGPASFNRTQVFTLGHTYFLPFGKGQRWLSNTSGVASQVISGWEWTGITSVESGMPFSPSLANNSSLNSDMSLRPNQIGNPFSGTLHNRNQWFNPAAYAVPGPFLFGGAGRDSLVGPPLFAADWSLLKNFKLSERFNLQFRWDVYNAFNYTNLANPSNTNTDTPTAGLITDVQSPMRNMQFGLHLAW